MAQITCGNCGGTHASAAEVRRCFAAGGLLDPTAPDPGIPFDEDDPGEDRPGEDDLRWGDPGRTDRRPAGGGSAARSRRPLDPLDPGGPQAEPLLRPATAWSGGPGSGRGLIVLPGDARPEPWADAPVLTVAVGADGVPAATAPLEEVAAHWARGERFVVEWAAPPGAPPAPLRVIETEQRAPWQLGVGFEFRAERLVGLLAQHAVDARHPDGARYLPAEAAVRAGAVPAERDGVDVLLDGRTEAVLDGGPLAVRTRDDGVVVVPVATLAAGRPAPLTAAEPSAPLAADQLAAVSHPGGGARIIAPAGSGKTRVLTERARLLLAGRRVPPSSVTLVAFNVRAAEEMRERTADLPALHIRTLNSLGLAIVNGGGPFAARADGRRLSTIDETEVRRILEQLVRFGRRAGTDPAAPWLEALSAVRLGLRDPAEVEADFGGDVDGLADVLPRYRAELERRGVLDFDEQIVAAVERLLRDPDARRRAQQACRVLLVDEFQDLAPAHLLLVRLLSAPTYDCFGVGDDDQTIYGYVGASPDWLVRFSHWFPGAVDHPLEVNYRCPAGVVEAASNLLTRNRRRVPKTIRPAPGREPLPDDVVVRPATDTAGETCDVVTDLVAGGVEPAAIAVLTRVNVTLLPVQLRLAAAGVPTTAPVDAQLLSRSGVRAALAWLAIAASADRARSIPAGVIGDAARRPPRGLSPRLVGWMDEQQDPDGLRRLAGRLTSARDADKVLAFAADVDLLRALVHGGADTATVLRAVAQQVGLGAAMETLDRSRGAVDRSAHGDDLAALESVAHLHPDPAGFGPWLRKQLTESGRAARPDGVHLATVHRVKGREWPYVVLHDASDGLLPHRLATDVEEERRVFHVGLTRSSVRTVIVAPAAAPSPFLAELAEPGTPPAETVPPRSASSPVTGSGATRGGRAPAAGTAGAADPVAVDALKAWRRERARKDGVAAFMVLPDRAIEDIARRRPGSLVELSRCHGIGPTKLDRYGDEVLAVIDGLA